MQFPGLNIASGPHPSPDPMGWVSFSLIQLRYVLADTQVLNSKLTNTETFHLIISSNWRSFVVSGLVGW